MLIKNLLKIKVSVILPSLSVNLVKLNFWFWLKIPSMKIKIMIFKLNIIYNYIL